MKKLALLVALALTSIASRADAQCDPVACAANASNTACNMSSDWQCSYGEFIGWLCLPATFSLPPVGSPCETDSNPCTVDACGGNAGEMYGDGICHHDPIANGTSCGTNMQCTSGSCGCVAGYKACGAGCVPVGRCCTDADCPDNAAAHLSGVCNGTGSDGCGQVCDPGYRLCNGVCTATSSCCSSTDCTSPPSSCYQPNGTCAGGTCTYAYANGAPCDADGTKCTPNDSCVDGVCVADTAHQVVCITKDCNGPPTCSADTGNCVYTPIPSAAGCGGDGCTPAGTCSAGVCSTAAQATDCSGLDTDCRVGLCDPDKPGTGTEKCGTANVPNDTPCALANKCLTGPVCSGGACVGTLKACAPSGECRAAACNPTTGDCEETVAAVGTACALAGGCLQNTACDATGSCVGDAVPDGSPCELAGCTGPACVAGQCVCFASADLGAEPTPVDPSSTADLGAGGGGDEGGCAVGGRGPSPAPLAVLTLGLLLARARRRAARPIATASATPPPRGRAS